MTSHTAGNPDELLVRAADAGDTYLSWRWIDTLDVPRATRLKSSNLDAALGRLDAALITQLSADESPKQAAARAMEGGAFTSLEQEQALASALSVAILPVRLVAEILARRNDKYRPRLRLTPSPRLARVPWEVLRVGEGDLRLLDVVDIVYDPPATVRAERSTPPRRWGDFADLPGLFIIDPATPGHPRPEFVVSFDTEAVDLIQEQIEGYVGSHGVLAAERHSWEGHQKYTRTMLSEALIREPRSRLFYYGHVTAEPDEPGSASLLLSDMSTDAWGMANPMGSHLPFSALDLLLGITTAPERERTRYPFAKSPAGPDIWPMPPRVAVIACEGGADYRSRETFGLVIAMLNAGAELITTTRWKLPTDVAFWRFHDTLRLRSIHPTTELALTVEAAHTSDDPIGALIAWQRRQLTAWRESGGAVEYSPIVWASLTNTWGPDFTAAPRSAAR